MSQGTHELSADFESEVLQASRSKPVLVDFWAEWCGPCRVLGPTLEALAEEAGDRWSLVKVNTELHPELGQRYGIQSIPAVKLFVDAEPVAEFVGALPEMQVRQWLDENLPTENAKRLAEARLAAEQGDPTRACPLLEQILADEPSHPDASLLLGRLLLVEDPARAATLIRVVPEEHPGRAQAESLLSMARLLELGRSGDASRLRTVEGHEAKPELVQRYLDGARALADDRIEDALEAWIEVIERDRKLDADGAREACIAAFAWLGGDHEITQKLHRRFSSALF